MKNEKTRNGRMLIGVLFSMTAFIQPIVGLERFQIEVYGGLSYLNPRDLNLLSKAEEQYNQLLYIERHFGWTGYFINDFPRITSTVPAG